MAHPCNDCSFSTSLNGDSLCAGDCSTSDWNGVLSHRFGELIREVDVILMEVKKLKDHLLELLGINLLCFRTTRASSHQLFLIFRVIFLRLPISFKHRDTLSRRENSMRESLSALDLDDGPTGTLLFHPTTQSGIPRSQHFPSSWNLHGLPREIKNVAFFLAEADLDRFRI